MRYNLLRRDSQIGNIGRYRLYSLDIASRKQLLHSKGLVVRDFHETIERGILFQVVVYFEKPHYQNAPHVDELRGVGEFVILLHDNPQRGIRFV